MKKIIFILVGLLLLAGLQAAERLSIPNVDTWRASALGSYDGKEVLFPVPVYVNSVSSGVTVSVRRMMSGTETCLPGSDEWKGYQERNQAGLFQLNGAGSNHRLGEVIENLVVKVNKSSIQYVSGDWVANSRAQLSQGPDWSALDQNGQHRLVVCAMNLEYYLVSDFGKGYGPRDSTEHKRQRQKTSKALAAVHADIYGVVEVQKGSGALNELAHDLDSLTGRKYKFITATSTAAGTYTQSAFIYCSETVQQYSPIIEAGGGPSDRRYMVIFKEISTGETFIFSINHFKAKSGNGTGPDADQHDGQGAYNASRTVEAQNVISTGARISQSNNEPDILVMGDLNAYSMEDPIRKFTDNGYTNLHKYFYNNASYSYYSSYSNEAGTLDHALANTTLLPQVTGMLAYHINSDENDKYTYDKSQDITMFRSSDHDPILVGLRLNSDPTLNDVRLNNDGVYFDGKDVIVYNARQNTNQSSYYAIYTLNGQVIEQGTVSSNMYTIKHPTPPGLYIIQVYANYKVHNFKIIVQ